MVVSNNDDRRRNERVGFTTPINIAIIVGGEKMNLLGSSRDLSLKGIFVNTQNKIPIGTNCSVEVSLSGSINKIVLKMKATIVRETDRGIGIAFDSMDVDTYTHLKNVVQYNSIQDSV
jgi:hypothetical protein